MENLLLRFSALASALASFSSTGFSGSSCSCFSDWFCVMAAVSAWQPALPILLYDRPSFLRLWLVRMTYGAWQGNDIAGSQASSQQVT